jgi:hypothetical protein
MAPSIINFLKLSDSDHLDTWNHILHHWETHSLSTPRHVVENQRLLYKLIPDGSHSLNDVSCNGLQEELAIQTSAGRKFHPGGMYIMPVTQAKSPSTPVKPSIASPCNIATSSSMSMGSLVGSPHRFISHSPTVDSSSSSHTLKDNCSEPPSSSLPPSSLLAPSKRKRHTRARKTAKKLKKANEYKEVKEFPMNI